MIFVLPLHSLAVQVALREHLFPSVACFAIWISTRVCFLHRWIRSSISAIRFARSSLKDGRCATHARVCDTCKVSISPHVKGRGGVFRHRQSMGHIIGCSMRCSCTSPSHGSIHASTSRIVSCPRFAPALCSSWGALALPSARANECGRRFVVHSESLSTSSIMGARQNENGDECEGCGAGGV